MIEGVSLFIGLRGINGTLTAFLGLLTDFKRNRQTQARQASRRICNPASKNVLTS